MKKLLILIAGLFFTMYSYVSAQDTIVLVNGTKIISKVTEISSKQVKYKDFTNLEGPDYLLENKEITSIHFKNGSVKLYSHSQDDDVDYINDIPVQKNANTSENQAQARVNENYRFNRDYTPRPGQKYSLNKRYYSPRDYMPKSGDPYNPAIAGVASYFVPGLGQMISGEVGRGFAYLGSTYGAYFVAGVGLGMIAGSSLQYYDEVQIAVGSLLALAGLGGGITLNILSIVDAVKVAKVNNMYLRDLRDNYVNIQLKPFIGTPDILSPVKNHPVGMTLSLSF